MKGDLDKLIGSLARRLKKREPDAADLLLVFVGVLESMEFTDLDLHDALRAREALNGILRDAYERYEEIHRRWKADTAMRGYPRDSSEADILASIKRSQARMKTFEKLGCPPPIANERRLLAERLGWLEAFRKAHGKAGLVAKPEKAADDWSPT